MGDWYWLLAVSAVVALVIILVLGFPRGPDRKP